MSVKKKNETMAIKSLNNEPSIFDETDPNFYKKKRRNIDVTFAPNNVKKSKIYQTDVRY